jgi:hypothetical protein
MLSYKVIDRTDIPKIIRDIAQAESRGVHIATEAGVQWLKNDVIEDQGFVGDPLYPDVTDETKQRKAKAGKEKVGKFNGYLVGSIGSDYKEDGLVGVISGGTEQHEQFLERWQLDALFYRERGEITQGLIAKELKKLAQIK